MCIRDRHISSSYAKILGENYFAHGSFPKVGQKQKTEKKKEERGEKEERKTEPVSYTHLRAHETVLDLVCRLLLLTHFGETPMCEIIFTQFFGITRRYMQKKNWGKFYFF